MTLDHDAHSTKEPDPESPRNSRSCCDKYPSIFSPIQPLGTFTPSVAAPYPKSTQSSQSMASRPPSLKSPERPRQPDESIGAFLPGLEQYQTSSRASETTSRNSSPTKTPLNDESIGAGTALPNQGPGDRHDVSLTEPVPAPTEVQQRPAPKPKSGKKGTASAVQYSVKRRKIDGSGDGTPSVRRSGTPASSRASKTPAPKNRKQQSVTSDRSSSPVDPEEDDGEEDEDAALFCVCRKPDDHTVMIACDGPCQDWFHERCVGIDEKDGNLIDKYICTLAHLLARNITSQSTCTNLWRIQVPIAN